METMKKGGRTAGIVALLLFALLVSSCDFFLFPEGYRQDYRFSSSGGLLSDVISVDVEGSDIWRIGTIYYSDGVFAVALSEYPGLLVYNPESFEKTGEYELDSGLSGETILYASPEAAGDIRIVTRNRQILLSGSTAIENSISFDYTDFSAGTQRMESLSCYFQYNDISYVIGTGVPGNVVNTWDEEQVDEISYPDGFTAAGSDSEKFTVSGGTLYAVAVSGVPVEPGTDLGMTDISEIATVKIGAFPLAEIGSWRDNSETYWRNALSIFTEEPVRHYREENGYAVAVDNYTLSGRHLLLPGYEWGNRIIDVSDGSTIFSSSGYLSRDGVLSSDGYYLYRIGAGGKNILEYKIR